MARVINNSEIAKRNRNNRKRGCTFEKVGADFLDMDVVPYSGSNARFGYGDVRDSIWLGEFKNITPNANNCVTIKYEWLTKNLQRATDIGKLSFLAWMPAGKSEKYIILDANTFMKFGITVLKFHALSKKSCNVKNFIINISDADIKGARKNTIGIHLEGSTEIWYMMGMEMFKEMMISHNMKGIRSIM